VLSVDQPIVDLGTLALNQSGVVVVTVTNIGAATANGIVFRTTGDLSLSGCSGILAVQSFCILTITANPTKVGPWSSTLTIFAYPVDPSPVQIAMTATVVPAKFSVSPKIIALGNILLGALIPPQVVTVSASDAIPDLAITTSGPDVAIDLTATTCGTALAAGASCVIVASITATSPGYLSDAIVLRYGGATGPLLAVHVTGYVQVPATLVITPSQDQQFVAAPGQASPAITLAVANIGDFVTGRLAVTVTGDSGADFEATSDCQVLTAFGTCSVTLVFQPSLASTTAGRTATVSVTDTDPGGASVSVGLSGIVSTPSVLAISPDTSNLGQVTIGTTSAATTFTVLHTGGAPLAALAVSLASNEFVLVGDTCTGTALAEGASCLVSVAFAPTLVGTQSATLMVTAAGTQPAVKMLNGKGMAIEVQFATPPAIDFGSVDLSMSSMPDTVLLKNSGLSSTGSLVLTMSGDAAHFQVSNNTCSTSLAPGENCTFEVTFAPKVTGRLAAVIDITDGKLATSVGLAGYGFVLHWLVESAWVPPNRFRPTGS
jgi:hypothetical protein